MTVRQFPQPGDIVATRAHDRGGADNLHGAVLIARRDEPPQSEATDLSNVVPFARPRRQAAAVFPLASVGAEDRPAPFVAKWSVGRRIALLAGSLALHGALLAMFWQDTRPMASIGIEVMTVEITLGATTAAGLAQTPSEQEAQAASPSEEQPQEQPTTEQARVATVMPQEVPVAAQETAPELKPQETAPEAQADELKPQEQQATLAEAPAQPTEKPPEQAQPRPQVQAVQKALERKRIAAPTDKNAAQKMQRTAAVASDAASGVGRGRSDNSANYNGIVAAHLARYKQYPAAARSAGSQGVATVSFAIDGGGRVTSTRLAGSSGNPAIDQEVVAMARRASPFPAPPDGKGRNFTVPVRFNLR